MIISLPLYETEKENYLEWVYVSLKSCPISLISHSPFLHAPEIKKKSACILSFISTVKNAIPGVSRSFPGLSPSLLILLTGLTDRLLSCCTEEIRVS